jgi:hypothetical protein
MPFIGDEFVYFGQVHKVAKSPLEILHNTIHSMLEALTKRVMYSTSCNTNVELNISFH